MLCQNNPCSRIAEVEQKIEAPSSLNAAASERTVVKKICIPCAEQEERMASVNSKSELNNPLL